MKRSILLFLFLLSVSIAFPQQREVKAENLILITIDGCRWQEVFGGADSVILYNEKFRKTEAGRLTRKFWAKTAEERRRKLMPFMWSTIAEQGRIYGNRRYENNVSVSNLTNISNPGYSEIFTGYADPEIKSNELKDNPNTNVFEFINKLPGFQGKAASFASWDRAMGYLNANRSGYMINGGHLDVTGPDLSPLQKTLNNLQQLGHRGESSRPDYITYLHAKEYLRLHQPRLLSIGLAWTDDMAHDGSYPNYLEKIFLFDNMIQDLWEYVQQIPQYKEKTAMLITVDHGRGLEEKWVSHGSSVPHSNEIWFAVMGPGISPQGEMKTNVNLYQNQFAQTAAKLLGLTFKAEHPIAEAISFK